MYKVLLITSNRLRHRYVANKIASKLDLCGIVIEEKAGTTSHLKEQNDWENRVIQKHFKQRSKAEKKLLGKIDSYPESVKVLNVKHGESNSDTVFEWIKNQNPTTILLYGSSIIKAPLLDYYENRIINLHLGLSPYYRGSGTNFWPLVDGYPECVGATIHLATNDVDAGDILAQVRPSNLKNTDGAHELGSKSIIAGCNVMCDVLPFYLSNQIQPIKQNLNAGKLCRRKDFNAEAVRKLWHNIENGMMENYLANKENRDTNYPIYTPDLGISLS